MSRIRVLAEFLANQIAAGEVVERPASVVKELVENAVDARSRFIQVLVEGSGTRRIQVSDDGEGMDEDDVLLCLERHATSKIRQPADLAAIDTLGFRGEALPSIASVSQLTIDSRPLDRPLGTHLEVAFGKVLAVRQTGAPVGTTVEVKNLFGNVPARRKFLKSSATELGHIEEVVVATGLAHPGIGLTLTIDGRERVHLPGGVDSREDRVRRLVPRGSERPLIRVQSQSPLGRLDGFLLPPDEGTSGWGRLRTVVNGRPVRLPMATHGVAEAMRSFLAVGRQPAGCLYFDLRPEEVDVNVHPTKQEARFRDGAALYRFVVAAVSSALAAWQEELRSRIFGSSPAVGRPRESPPEAPAAAVPLFSLGESEPHSWSAEPDGGAVPQIPDPPSTSFPVSSPAIPAAGPSHSPAPAAASPPGEGARPAVPLRVIGQLLDSYILCQGGDRLVAIDQHAAHERILFETLTSQYEGASVPSQRLLFPTLTELGLEEAELVRRHQEQLERLGFVIELFGGETFRISAVPGLTAHLPPEEVLAGVLSGLAPAASADGRRGLSPQGAVLASLACRAAIKAGQPLRAEEMTSLVSQLAAAPALSHCPHGRPVTRSFAASEIRRWFLRA
ncbi:MAG: DNA mismatch repair endonuclease MutL [Thermodesulfobacteriota bacterium]